MATLEAMKSYVKIQGKAHLVKELVVGLDMEVSDAVEYVYDHITMSREEFSKKYF